jgi:hypothetical protein
VTGDRRLIAEEQGLLGVEKFALDAIQGSGGEPSLFEAAFLELKGAVDSHKSLIVTLSRVLVEAGIVTREELFECLGR